MVQWPWNAQRCPRARPTARALFFAKIATCTPPPTAAAAPHTRPPRPYAPNSPLHASLGTPTPSPRHTALLQMRGGRVYWCVCVCVGGCVRWCMRVVAGGAAHVLHASHVVRLRPHHRRQHATRPPEGPWPLWRRWNGHTGRLGWWVCACVRWHRVRGHGAWGWVRQLRGER